MLHVTAARNNRVCQFCHQEIGAPPKDAVANKTVAFISDAEWNAHVWCLRLHQEAIKSDHYDSIALINTVRDLKALIESLDDSMPVMCIIGKKRTTPTMAVELAVDGKSLILEIRS